MRVAYFYNQERLSPDDARTNPYGPLLAAALEQRGVTVEFSLNLDESFLRQNQDRIDILHLNWPHFDYFHEDAPLMEARLALFTCRLELARALGYKIIWTAHNLYPHNRQHMDLDHHGRMALCRLATAVIVHCSAAAESVSQTFGRTERIFVIPHGNYFDVYPATISREEAREHLGLPSDAFVYGFFGSIQPYKGVEALIHDFARLSAPDSWLLLSGGASDSTYLETLRQSAADLPHVVFWTFPRMPSEDIGVIMQATDVVTLPFVATMTSGTLILALSWGRPVIAPSLGCLPETVTPEAGILYDPHVPHGLHRALREIRRRDLDAAGRSALSCAKQLDWDWIAELTMEAYRA